jgi:hypothetical protein
LFINDGNVLARRREAENHRPPAAAAHIMFRRVLQHELNFVRFQAVIGDMLGIAARFFVPEYTKPFHSSVLGIVSRYNSEARQSRAVFAA